MKDYIAKLKQGGIIVAPIGSRLMQTLTSMRKTGDKIVVEREIPGFIFVHFVD